ncbi:MAG: Holliday junction branch migration protein RuvA [Dysgonamonadaceae bacterium]|jgi:Holliday junction DNA helicase RuvA|nr:Holliday junction branch migration protein RuvA [Dysgonamonadaceae bacterium]
MLDFIKGEIVELNPASVVVNVGGLGYVAQISLYTYSALNGSKEAKVYVYEAIREDAHLLFGFIDKRERELFLLLISVSGVGANTARVILSSLNPKELESAISSGNSNALKAVKGIGAKTAERIIIDLKDKVKLSGSDDLSISPTTTNDITSVEAIAALVMLGFNQAASQKVVSRIVKENPDITVERLIKLALKML